MAICPQHGPPDAVGVLHGGVRRGQALISETTPGCHLSRVRAPYRALVMAREDSAQGTEHATRKYHCVMFLQSMQMSPKTQQGQESGREHLSSAFPCVAAGAHAQGGSMAWPPKAAEATGVTVAFLPPLLLEFH